MEFNQVGWIGVGAMGQGIIANIIRGTLKRLGESTGNGIHSALRPRSIHVDMSTIFPALSAHIFEIHKANNVHFIQCPVFGRPDVAEAGKLLLVAAGNPSVINKLEPLLKVIGRATIKLSEKVDTASTLKLIGNMFILNAMETISEGLVLGEKNNVPKDTILEFIDHMFGIPVYQGYAKRMSSNDFNAENGASVAIGLKDSGHVLKVAENSGVQLPSVQIGRKHLETALERGRGDLDWGALITVVRENSGLKPGI
eukprot:TRINITY_DN886_c0_g1_i1.p1 TRINITY_DN886_c0_g1~~TRINITY_DN886_c0_g1_i1.p1  ORF type:complete len:289 (+),score=77.11 TRINITY_DN886_c0_g1_i1:103-867(+)